MSPWIAVAVAAALAWLVWSRLRPDPLRLADRAVVTGDLAPVLHALGRLGPGAAPTEYHRVLRRLWEGYHREEAAEIAKDFARHHRDAPVAQYWLDKILKGEPEIARAHLDEEFLGECFDPAVARKCGNYG